MEHLKLIGSAAYLKLIIDPKTKEHLVGIVILAGGYSGELFYNQDDGLDIIDDYLLDNEISKEEHEYLSSQILDSGLTEEPIEEVDKGLSYVRSHIDSLKKHCTREYIITSTKENFPTYPPEIIDYLFEESIIQENNSQQAVN